MVEPRTILIGKSSKPEYLTLKLANRHGLVTGATGTGKTVTLQVLAEGFSNAGVPVFAADIKGDLSGIAAPGNAKPAFVKRAQEIGLDYVPDRFPVVFWDLFGEEGHRIRATVSEMGPLLLARLLDLNDTQEGVLNIAFRVADEQGLTLLDLKDLRAILGLIAENAAELQKAYGNVSAATVGTIREIVMEELLARVTQATGLDAATATKALGIILAFLKKEGPPNEVNQLLAAIPGAGDAVAQAGGTGGGGLAGMMGSMGGGVMALGGQLMGAGVSMGQMQPLGRELFAYGREKAGEDVMGPIVGAIPGLSQFM